MASILETRSLQKRFGGLQAVANVDFEIDDGELHCLIGPNGAGKSTLFKLILGRYPPTAGTIRFRGEDITHVHSYDRVRRGMSIKMQVPGIFKDLSVRQNLAIALQDHCRPARLAAEIDRLAEFADLTEQATQLAGNLSHGQQQWLEIGMAVAIKPSLLLLDEPTAGMSPEETFKTGEMVHRLNAERMTILVVEHDMTFIRQIARRITVMHLGTIFAQGTIDEITRHEGVSRIYLGESHGG